MPTNATRPSQTNLAVDPLSRGDRGGPQLGRDTAVRATRTPRWQRLVEDERARTGSDRRFHAVCDELMRDHARLVRLCQGYLWQAAGVRANVQDAEDIASIAVLQTAAVAGSQDPQALFAHIANLRAIDFARGLRPVVSLDAPRGPGTGGDGHRWLADSRSDDPYLAVDDRLEAEELARRLRHSAILKDTQLAAAEAVAACDGDVRGAATLLGITPSALTSRMHGVREKLRTKGTAWLAVA